VVTPGVRNRLPASWAKNLQTHLQYKMQAVLNAWNVSNGMPIKKKAKRSPGDEASARKNLPWAHRQ
jgi:hypothetical protein